MPESPTREDLSFMAHALRLAERGIYSTDPNPRVGCIIVQSGRIIGQGWHKLAGGDHAEIDALKNCVEDPSGATAYVTLEPCSHQGRTGPCCQALLRSGVRRVVSAMQDPFPEVAGRGIDMLRQGGVEVVTPCLENEARRLNPGYLKRLETGRPLVRLKVAMSMDGRTALENGVSKWITGTEARRDVQRWRARSSAVLTGIGTLLADDPALDVRRDELQPDGALPLPLRQPLRVIVDSTLRTPPDSRIFDSDGEVLVATTVDPGSFDRAPVITLAATAEGRVSLQDLLLHLGSRACNEVLVEAGSELSGAFVESKLVDELIIYVAPRLMGDRAQAVLTLPAYTAMDQVTDLDLLDTRKVGDDLRILARLKSSL